MPIDKCNKITIISSMSRRNDLRAIRQELGLTQRKMSALLRLAPDTVRQYEGGHLPPGKTIELFYKLFRDGVITIRDLEEYA